MSKETIRDVLSKEFGVLSQDEFVGDVLSKAVENQAIVIVGLDGSPVSLTDPNELAGLSSGQQLSDVVAELPSVRAVEPDMSVEDLLADTSLGGIVAIEGTKIVGVLRHQEMARLRRSFYRLTGLNPLPGDPSTGAPGRRYKCAEGPTGPHYLEPSEVDRSVSGKPICPEHGGQVSSEGSR